MTDQELISGLTEINIDEVSDEQYRKERQILMEAAARIAALRSTLRLVKQTLAVPAAESGIAIVKAWELIDAALGAAEDETMMKPNWTDELAARLRARPHEKLIEDLRGNADQAEKEGQHVFAALAREAADRVQLVLELANAIARPRSDKQTNT